MRTALRRLSSFAPAVLFAVACVPGNALAQTSRDMIPIGMEFCLIAAESPERAAPFALASGLVPGQNTAETMSFSPPGENEQPIMMARVYRHEDGFALECGFAVRAVGDVADEEIAALASRFDLTYSRGDGGTYAFLRQTTNLIVLAYAGPTDGFPCPDEGLEIAPEVLSEHPGAMDAIMEICGKRGFRITVQSAYSQTAANAGELE
ncbi:hypothetical protein [Terricaulis silvestris]|uniref:Uncharacterized protein n=1 Tax=Terricaulis silvestris TaxID=2686094 RepID=A0A6I6MW12_9CAUL|nr:hypothetical protein [Terricaulis silvestris]QGZ96937.1 hypothetical protein DSM104635_03802 [Terricaulis silvestris]